MAIGVLLLMLGVVVLTGSRLFLETLVIGCLLALVFGFSVALMGMLAFLGFALVLVVILAVGRAL